MPKVQNTQSTRERGAGRPFKSGSNASPELPTSLTACKKQVRNVTRLLTRQTLNSATRTDLERRLKALTILQSQMSSAQTDKTNASRYHSIKFFERKKVIRKLTQLEKKIEKDGKDGLEDELTELLVSLNYTTYYPDEYKYISLFPADPTKTTSETKERQAFIQKRIARAMENGKLPRDPREVNAEDRKAIRKGNKLLLRSVSQAHGKASTDQSGSESGDSAAEGDDADEFFE
ncbi:18S rRNA maturation protein [Coemansia sp. RSA 2523]|nr:18S rRNA maturation protein [Coemansia sp. RSA 1824]KAJ1762118.1 18S rRNA maturation protein [Coemansia sp. RSA 1591]KAJ1766678.1 18S rRNA maturation protein [Coemansia sp. RSA 1752]KAJ1791119.1 18S rRNA maturation protein [Coemansia sp. RSA 2167]KAJ1794452.1 18S rRNA maturation protein [Coemansia sp. RSA 1938]KAJ1801093.1 18S rRNA maturation protein [Coemansia sp. RSA 2523]KAJ2147695.1 18S rRNA maturation protein [Coemansia sp. RSA 564]KAJ2168617.1 18S rRNA maturation protein [Coemansia 